jgi:hypothetical protein
LDDSALDTEGFDGDVMLKINYWESQGGGKDAIGHAVERGHIALCNLIEVPGAKANSGCI